MLFWIALFGRALNSFLDFATEIHIGLEATEHMNALIVLCHTDLFVIF